MTSYTTDGSREVVVAKLVENQLRSRASRCSAGVRLSVSAGFVASARETSAGPVVDHALWRCETPE